MWMPVPGTTTPEPAPVDEDSEAAAKTPATRAASVVEIPATTRKQQPAARAKRSLRSAPLAAAAGGESRGTSRGRDA